jgi:putative transcriptional regulator
MIVINIDVMLAKRKMSVTELSEKVGITMANMSILKTGKAGDILEYKQDEGIRIA